MLLAALLAIVLIGALVTGVMFATTEDTRAGSAGLARESAMNAVETAIARTLTNGATILPASIGTGGTRSETSESEGISITVYITRLDSTVYLVVGEAVGGASRLGAHRRVGVLVNTVRRTDGSISIAPISQRAWSEFF